MNILYDGRISADCADECVAGACAAPRMADGCGACCGCLGGCVQGYAEQTEEYADEPYDADEAELGQSIVDVHLPDMTEVPS